MINTTNNLTEFIQLTSVECWDDNGKEFNRLLDKIEHGEANYVVEILKTYPKSDRDTIKYKDILTWAAYDGENIVYYDFNYLLTANNNIMVLYKRNEER